MQRTVARFTLRCVVVLIVAACLILCLLQILSWSMHEVWENVQTLELGFGVIAIAILLEPAFMNEQIQRRAGRFLPPALRTVGIVSVFLALIVQVVFMLDQHTHPPAFDGSLLLALMGFFVDVAILSGGSAVLRAAIHLRREARAQK